MTPEEQKQTADPARKQKAAVEWKLANQKLLHAQAEAYFALIELLEAHGLLK